MRRKENNILGDLIRNAIRSAYTFGSGWAEDEEEGTALGVSAYWVEGSEDPNMCELCITISQEGRELISYNEPGIIEER